MKEYSGLKNTFDDNFKKENRKLNQFNYYYDVWRGTLLHGAVYGDFVGYAELLLKDGFDPNMKNRHKYHKTPVAAAQDGGFLMKCVFNEYSKSDHDKDSKEDCSEKEELSMNVGSLSLKYDSFTNSFMSAIYFLKCCGFIDIYKNNDKRLKIKDGYLDNFVCEISNLSGLKMCGDTDSVNNISCSNVMPLFLKCCQSLIKLKMSLSIDVLILSCIYANYIKNNSFFHSLKSNIIECLNGTDENYKERNYQWFKLFILNSNLWLVNVPTPHDDNTILFDTVVDDVNELLMKQKEFIWKNVETIKNSKETNVIFEELCNFGVNNIRNNADLRQDKIENGIVSNVNERELIIKKHEMGSAHSIFDLKSEMNCKTYLTKCLVFAHSNNNTFQSQMKEYFKDKKCKYQSAPVKLRDRCVVKATSDYGKKHYPSCANILDFMRFSVTFDNVNDLLNGLNQFTRDINKGNVISCLLPNGVLRIKNGFNEILTKWKSKDDADYVDIKLNIIYMNKTRDESMIIEAQFLLSFLLQAKKMGHKYYSIVRQSSLINSIKNTFYVIDNNYEKYKSKILTFAHNHDNQALMKQLFFKPHVVLSIIIPQDNKHYPRPLFVEMMYQFGEINVKFVLFFLNCLFYHSFLMLEEKNDETNIFLKKYFNWGKPWGYGDDGCEFYGISSSSVLKSSSEELIVNLILKKEYLRVLNFLKVVCHFFSCCHFDRLICCLLFFQYTINYRLMTWWNIVNWMMVNRMFIIFH